MNHNILFMKANLHRQSIDANIISWFP